MQLLDETRQDKSLPCVSSEGANCQQSYYSAYKCKANMVDASMDASQETVKGGTGAKCIANSPGMVAENGDTACGRLLASYRGTVNHGKLFHWITNLQGPKMWSKAQHAAFCSVSRPTRPSRKKYALVDCSKLSNVNEVFVPCADGDTSPDCTYDPFKDATVRL